MYRIPLLEKTGVFANIDLQFAGFMAGLSKAGDPAIPLAAALVSSKTRGGDVCVDLAGFAGLRLNQENRREGAITCPQLNMWRDTLLKSGIVGEPEGHYPLILDDQNRLYLFRYWEYEKKLADFLLDRAARETTAVDIEVVKASLVRLFPEKTRGETDWQKVAAIVATLKNMCIVSGGPGTGKTFAVARILALLLEQNRGKNLKIYLAAPTGKAAARLMESISQAKQNLPCDSAIKSAIPDEGCTIHRMLKSSRDASRFFYHAENRLPADVVVVDEASMVDLPLMSKMVQALSHETRLLLLGDRDQLASVEAGSVLGDICGSSQTNVFSDDFRNRINAVAGMEIKIDGGPQTQKTGLRDCTVYFTKSFRFDARSGILTLSRIVNTGRSEKVIDLLKAGSYGDVQWLPLNGKNEFFIFLEKRIIQNYRIIVEQSDPVKALARMRQFRILCAVNNGPYGVRAINKMAVEVLENIHAIKREDVVDGAWYHGRPVLIKKNDYRLGLYNGDMGIAMIDPEADGKELSVFFVGGTGEVRRFAPYRLPEHETVYAMTVHKSQGSEFDDVLLILPEKDTPVLTKELLYTGITRARRNLSLLCSESAISNAVSRRIERASGLRDKMAKAIL